MILFTPCQAQTGTNDIPHFTSSHQRFILKFVNTIPLPLKYSSALIQASHSICRSLILCWISKILFTEKHTWPTPLLCLDVQIFFPLCWDIFTLCRRLRGDWAGGRRWGGGGPASASPGPGPPFSGATIHQHRAPGTLAYQWSLWAEYPFTRTYITSFHLSGQLQVPRLDSVKLTL